MTVTDTAPTTSRLGYGLFDADQHFYEAEDAVTRHLDPAHRDAVRWIDVSGRRTLLVNDRLFKMYPNPTFDPVAGPGVLEPYFRGENMEGRSLRDLVGDMEPCRPEFRNREARLAQLDRQGVEFAWVLPTLAIAFEQMMSDNPPALTAVFHALHRWIEDEWGWARDDRMHVPVPLSFVDPEGCEQALAAALRAGARSVVIRPAPVNAPGDPRSLGDPRHDRVWAMIAEANMAVIFHGADSGYGKYARDWGEGDHFRGYRLSAFEEILGLHIERPAFDTMAAMVAHGVFDRHPTLRVAALELGSGWVGELITRMRHAYGKNPQKFRRDPVESFLEHVWVNPFYEDDLRDFRDMVGVERILFGSDWPHPEGLADPVEWVKDIAGFPADEQRLVMRDNLRGLVFG